MTEDRANGAAFEPDERDVGMLVRGFGRRFREHLPFEDGLPGKISALVDQMREQESICETRSAGAQTDSASHT